MWKLDYKESWVPRNWCFWTVALEKTLESPLDCKEIQPVHPKGDQSWVFIGGTDVEAETPILWPPDVESWLIWKDPDAGKIEGRRRRGQQRMRWLDGITDTMDMGLGRLRELVIGRPGVLQFMGSQRVGHDWATELNWTWPLRSLSYEEKWCMYFVCYSLSCKYLYRPTSLLPRDPHTHDAICSNNLYTWVTVIFRYSQRTFSLWRK